MNKFIRPLRYVPPCTAPRAFRFNKLAPVPTAAVFLLAFDRRWELPLLVADVFFELPVDSCSFLVVALVEASGTAGGGGKSFPSSTLSAFFVAGVGAVSEADAATGSLSVSVAAACCCSCTCKSLMSQPRNSK